MMITHLKLFAKADTPLLAQLIRASIEGLGAVAYSQRQRMVWAEFVQDEEALSARLGEGMTWVLWQGAVPLCLGQLHPCNHVNMLYTSPTAARQGWASHIYARLEESAMAAGSRILTTEASLVARPFFESRGFRVLEKEIVVRGGVELERFRMKKDLAEAGSINRA